MIRSGEGFAGRRAVAVCGALLVLCVLLAHGTGLSGGFVYDDHRFIEKNEAIASLARPLRFLTDPGTASAAQGVEPDVWRPLRTLAFAVDRALFGLAPFGWHVAGLALHAANVLLLWVLALRILGRRGAGDAAGRALIGATLAAALFAVHPATVECVAWVSSRGDLLAWTCVLLAFEAMHRPGLARTLVGAALVATACLAKESAIVAFALLPLRDAALPPDARPPRRTTLARTALLAAVTAGYLVARQAVLPTPSDLPWLAQTAFPEGSRAAAARGALASVAWYARVLLVPTGFPFDRNVYTDPTPISFGEPSVVVGLAVLLSLALAGVLALRRGRGAIAFACLGAIVAWVPVSNVLVPLKAFAAERFLYPVLPCLAVGVAAAGTALATRLPRRGRTALLAAAAAATGACLLLCRARTEPWHDEESLWTAVVREEPMNPRAYEGLGFVRLSQGHLGAAERAFGTYLEFQPFDGKVRAELAAVFRRVYDDFTSGGDPAGGEGADRVEAPRSLLATSIEWSRAAMDLWARVGLERGRGDAVLVRANLEGWRGAALDYGDLREARRANALLAAEDVAAVGAEAYPQRRMRAILASLAISAPPQKRDSKADLARDLERRRVRAEILGDLGIDPALPDADAQGRLLPVLAALLAERPADEAVRRNRVQAMLSRVEGLSGAEQDRELGVLEADLDVLARAHPEDRGLARTLAAVRARRAR